MKNLIKKISNKKTYIVAEVSSNHNGSMKLAKKLILDAKYSGADCVKFQLFDANKTVAIKNLKIKLGKKKINQIKILKKNQLSLKMINQLYIFAKKNRIDFSTTVTENEHIDFLSKLNLPFIKIASADIINHELIKYCLKKIKNKFLVISTGMANFHEINKVIKIMKKNNFSKFILLHCVSLYPTKIKMANLERIKKLKKRFKCKVGYSDHTNSISAAISSVFFGSIFLEKHFYDKKIKSIDSDFSSDKSDFKKMVKIIRENEIILESKYKESIPEEKKMIKKFRKGVYLNKILQKNQTLNFNDLKFSRPFNGFKIENVQKLIGKKAKKKLLINSDVNFKNFY